MAATPQGNPKFQAFDPDTNEPLVGGLVYTYDAGTTTPATTWTNAAKSATNANPVVLDSNGQASIFIDGTYKFTVHNSDDELLYTVDNVIGGSGAFDKPASGITFLPYDDIAATNVQDALEELADERVKTTTLAGYLALAGGVMTGALTVVGLTFSALVEGADQVMRRVTFRDVAETVQALGSAGGTRTVDMTLGNVATLTVASSANTLAITNPPASGLKGHVTLIITNGGSQTFNWPSGTIWPSGLAPALTSSGIDVVQMFTIDAGTTWYAFPAGLGMA